MTMGPRAAMTAFNLVLATGIALGAGAAGAEPATIWDDPHLSVIPRTAKEAADTLGCEVAQIAKSIVFRDPAGDQPVLAIASGSNRVSIDKLRTLSGLALEQANGGFDKKRLGFAIGGVGRAGGLLTGGRSGLSGRSISISTSTSW